MLSRIGVAILLVAGVRLGFSQTTPPPASAPGEVASQTQDQTQDQTPTDTAGQGAETEQSTGNAGGESRAQVPPALNMDSGSLEFSGERGRSNRLEGGVGAGAFYNDNLLSVETPHIGGFSYTVYPDLAVEISRPRLVLKVEYEGGYTFNQRFSAYNQGAHNAKVDVQYRLSPHVNLRLQNRFTLTTGFFDQTGTVDGVGTGIVQQPNLGVITPFTRHTFDVSTAQLTYQYSAGDMIGVSGTGNISEFGAPPGGAPALTNNQEEEGDAFYTHRFTPRNWSGIAYTFQRLAFDPAIEQVNVHTIMLFHSIYLKPNMVLGIFAGPEYTQLNNQIVSTSVTLPYVTVNSISDSQGRWSATGGASLTWSGRHTALWASGVRKVSDGGGLLTAVDVTTGAVGTRRQLSRSSKVELSGMYVDSRALDQGATTVFGDLKLISGRVSLEQELGRSFSTTFAYAHDYQQQAAPSLSLQNVNSNRAWVTFSYQFTRPLGQ